MSVEPSLRQACRTGCPTPGAHATWGECARDAGIQIDRFALVGSNEPMEKRKEQSLARYRDMRKAGLEPLSPLKRDMDVAEAAHAHSR